jgi:hypothetical protein
VLSRKYLHKVARLWRRLDVCLLPMRFLTLEIMNLQYQQNPAWCHRRTVSGVTTRSACCQPDQRRRKATPKHLSTLEDDQMLTKRQILEKETVMRAKKANQRSEAESKETKHGAEL